MPSKGLIYFIQEGFDGAIKIGYTTNLPRRFETLQTGNSNLLHILGVHSGTRADEQRTQKIFDSIRKRGEWFYPTKDLKMYIRAKTGSIQLDKDLNIDEYSQFCSWKLAQECAINEILTSIA